MESKHTPLQVDCPIAQDGAEELDEETELPVAVAVDVLWAMAKVARAEMRKKLECILC